MAEHIAICFDGFDAPEDLTVMVKCDYCPYCGTKAEPPGSTELHIFNEPETSVVFHNPHLDVNDICEIPDSLA